MERQNRETSIHQLLKEMPVLWPGTPFCDHVKSVLNQLPGEVLDKLEDRGVLFFAPVGSDDR